MASRQTIKLPHLGLEAGYALSNNSYDSAKPTCVLINSMCTTTSLYREQLADKRLTSVMNLLAIDPLGHGSTSCLAEHFTYWDTAMMALQVLNALNIEKAFALGTSQGGWIVTRMALLEPNRIQGIFILGSSMDAESARSREQGCWDPATFVKPFLDRWTSDKPTPGWVVEDDWIDSIVQLGFGTAATPANVEFWTQTLRDVYKGDEARRRLKMATICLVERDGLIFRLPYVQCPVHWLHGDTDPVYNKQIAEEHIKLFTGAKETKLSLLEGGAHFLNMTHPKEVGDAMLEMVKKYAQAE